MEKQPSFVMRVINAFAGKMNRIAGIMLFFLMLLTLIDVLLRKLWSKGILGGLELSEFMLAGMVFCALAQAEIENRHIRVDLFVFKGKSRFGKYVEALVPFLCALLTGTISLSCLFYGLSIHGAAEVSPDLGIPRYPMILVAALGCALLGAVMLIRSWRIISTRRP